MKHIKYLFLFVIIAFSQQVSGKNYEVWADDLTGNPISCSDNSPACTLTVCLGQTINFYMDHEEAVAIENDYNGACIDWNSTFCTMPGCTTLLDIVLPCTFTTVGTYEVTTLVNAPSGPITNFPAKFVIIVLPASANAGLDVTICSGQSTTLNASGGGTYSWSPTTGLSNPLISNPVATPTSTTTYTVTVTNANGCVKTDQVVVTVNPKPTIPVISGIANNCSSNSIPYTVPSQAGVTFAWSIPAGTGTFAGGISTGTSVTINWTSLSSTPTTITVTATNTTTLCQSVGILQVVACCYPDPIFVVNRQVNNTSTSALTAAYGGSTTMTYAGNIVINGTLTVDNNYTFLNCPNIRLAPLAKIVVQNTRTLTLNTCVLRAACDYMWDGIYVQSTTSQVIVHATAMMEAKNSIVSENGGNFQVRNGSLLQNNYKHIIVRNYNPNSPQPVHPAKIYNSTLTYNTPLIAPYSGQKTFIGIDVNFVAKLTIGDPAQTKNIFSNLIYGIYTYDADVAVYNNDFNNIYINSGYLTFTSFGPSEGAIFSNKSGATLLNVQAKTVVGNSGTSVNNFNSCNYGIFTYNTLSHLNYNVFNGTKEHIWVKDPKNNSTITFNSITASNSGTGIKVHNVNITPSGTKIDITNNTILGTVNGIWVTNLASSGSNQVTVGDNSVTYFVTSTSPRYGVRVENSNNIIVSYNIVSKFSALHPTENATLRGISISATQGGFIHDNGPLERLGQGIRTTGTLTNTQFVCNEMRSCFNGFYFDVNTALSQQGAPGINSGNTWYTIGGDRMAGDPLVHPGIIGWYYGTNPAENPNPVDADVNAKVSRIMNGSGTSQCGQGFTGGGGQGMSSLSREEQFGAIVRDEIEYVALEDENKAYNKTYAFGVFDNDSSLLDLNATDDSEYQQFYEETKVSNIGKFNEIFELLESGNDMLAQEKNNQIVAVELLDQNRKTTNSIYLNSLAKDSATFTEDQYNTLLSIALQTPNEGGDAVFSARVMLGIDPDDYGIAYKTDEEYQYDQIQAEIKVYPNPTQLELFIEATQGTGDKAHFFVIWNVNGTKALEIPVPPNTYKIRVDTKMLHAGIYMYTIVDKDNISMSHGKLMIVE